MIPQIVLDCLKNKDVNDPFVIRLDWIAEFPNYPKSSVPKEFKVVQADVKDIGNSDLCAFGVEEYGEENAVFWKRTSIVAKERKFAVDTLESIIQVNGKRKSDAKSVPLKSKRKSIGNLETIAEEAVEVPAEEQRVVEDCEMELDACIIPEGHIQIDLFGAAQDSIKVCRAYEFAGVYLDEEETNFLCVSCWPIEAAYAHNSKFANSLMEIQPKMNIPNESPRNLIIDLLRTYCVNGDELSSEYLLLNMLSRIQGSGNRSSLTHPGKLNVNLVIRNSNEGNENIARRISNLHAMLLPNSHYLEFSIESLKHRKFYASKNMETNQLEFGDLYMSSGSPLVVDETAMRVGELNEIALKNVAALNELVQNQNVSIDYSVQSLSIPVDVPVLLVTAESKSLLQTEAVVYLEELHSHTGMFPFDSILNVQSQNASVHPIVGLLREYILHGRAMYPSISREVAEVIEQDLVMIRKDRPESDPILQMLNLVTLACLVACSYLSTELKVEHWRHAVQMDVLKNERIQKAKAEQLL